MTQAPTVVTFQANGFASFTVHRRLRCARHIYELRDGAGAEVFAGVRYLSRLNPDWECWAIFADRMVHTPGFAATISPNNPDLLSVCRLFNLDVETLRGKSLS